MATRITLTLLALALALGCAPASDDDNRAGNPGGPGADGKGDGLSRTYQVVLTDPHCDVCTGDDKNHLAARSDIVARTIEVIDAAERQLDAAQFTFSARPIEAALLRAHERGVAVRLAMNAAQSNGDNPANRLKAAGVDVRFVKGREAGSFAGLQHGKFLIADGTTVLTGSNNWSSTGTTINEENVVIIRGVANDALITAFTCHFKAVWTEAHDASDRCSVENLVGFSPGSSAIGMLVGALRGAERSIDVLMHHLLFDRLIKELERAAARGVRVRVVVNAVDLESTRNRAWDRLRAAGVQIRYKQTNPDQFQLMHHKLAIVDDRVLLNGSGNWSGSGFFNNFENYIRYDDPAVVAPFRGLFARLWSWSLTADSLKSGRSAARQGAEETRVYFGNLHAHYHAHENGRLWDDGRPERHDDEGEPYSVEVGDAHQEAARFAFEYARDRGKLDFMALSPHVIDDRSDDAPNIPNLHPEGYAAMREAAAKVTDESGGRFLAIPSMEWSTNSTGNHVNIFGSRELAKVERGRFDLLYDDFLPTRARMGEPVLLMFNHPRTFRHHEGALTGNWDQIFDVDLSEIPNRGERRQKFNDYGLDDYPPLRDVRQSWIEGEALPDRQVVAETLKNIEAASRPYLRLMEVTVARGTELGTEEPTNPSLNPTEDGDNIRYTKVYHDWAYYLLSGFKLAPAANHDNHLANWGTGHTTRTAILAPLLTEANLLDAIDARAVYATEAPSLQVRFHADGRIPMGGTHRTLSDRVEAELHLTDPSYTGRYTVRLIRGTVGKEQLEEAQAFDTVAPDQWHGVALDLPGPGQHLFFLEVHALDVDQMAWTAPIWIERLGH